MAANRIVAAIARATERIDEKSLSGPQRRTLEEAASLDAVKHARLNDAKSLAHASGILSLDEATTVYAILGESAAHFNRQSLAERIVVIQLSREILDAKARARAAASGSVA